MRRLDNFTVDYDRLDNFAVDYNRLIKKSIIIDWESIISQSDGILNAKGKKLINQKNFKSFELTS